MFYPAARSTRISSLIGMIGMLVLSTMPCCYADDSFYSFFKDIVDEQRERYDDDRFENVHNAIGNVTLFFTSPPSLPDNIGETDDVADRGEIYDRPSPSPSSIYHYSPSPTTLHSPDSATNPSSGRRWFSFIFRFLGIEILLCWPCISSLRIWYKSGGRIKFRWSGGLDENGRGRGWIIGLRHQRPDPERLFMLSGGRVDDRPTVERANNAATSTNVEKLTIEQVRSLPEIEAPDPITIDTDNDLEMVDVKLGTDDADELAATYHGNIENQCANPDLERQNLESLNADSSIPNATAPIIHTTTMSTSCSICIEDFVAGEKLRLLPLCGHSFHTECIVPWLTERQGCCPYCKTPVIICPMISTDSERARAGEENNNE